MNMMMKKTAVSVKNHTFMEKITSPHNILCKKIKI
jgi:hypothetical protein